MMKAGVTILGILLLIYIILSLNTITESWAMMLIYIIAGSVGLALVIEGVE